MKPIKDTMNLFIEYMQDNLPAILLSYNLDDFGAYQVGVPFNVDELILAAYLATGTHTEDFANETFLLQAQLPRVLDPLDYHTAISKLIIQFEADTVWASSLEYTYSAFYPGEVKDGGGGSYLLYEISINGELDDCRSENNY